MGGGHHAHPIKIPDYKIYKVENVPELMMVKKALAAKGLKDPWLRNEVWKYNTTQTGTTRQIFRKTFGRGMAVGLVAAVITTGIEMAFSSGHGHGDDHGKEGHGHH